VLCLLREMGETALGVDQVDGSLELGFQWPRVCTRILTVGRNPGLIPSKELKVGSNNTETASKGSEGHLS
jgi:hypothetical protein